MTTNTIIRVNSPANIAFIKYWGQRDPAIILPFNDSISMNLSGCHTTIELTVVDDPDRHELAIKDYKAADYAPTTGTALQKVIAMYTTTREFLGSDRSFGFSIRSENSFPKKAGIASSASFFSGLALAFSKAFGSSLSPKELSILARLSGSGSASRSIPDGFVHWHRGTDSASSYAESIGAPDYWPLVDIVLIATSKEKQTGSDDGHRQAATSPAFKYRQMELEERIPALLDAFSAKDFTRLGTIIEDETLSLHRVMMTQATPLYYWSGKTIGIMKDIIGLRARGTEVYYTIDAGENVHAICLAADAQAVRDHFAESPDVEDIIINHPTIGARLV